MDSVVECSSILPIIWPTILHTHIWTDYFKYPRKHSRILAWTFKKEHMLVWVHKVVFSHSHKYKTDGLMMAETACVSFQLL
jgi:hypothetical protein